MTYRTLTGSITDGNDEKAAILNTKSTWTKISTKSSMSPKKQTNRSTMPSSTFGNQLAEDQRWFFRWLQVVESCWPDGSYDVEDCSSCSGIVLGLSLRE